METEMSHAWIVSANRDGTRFYLTPENTITVHLERARRFEDRASAERASAIGHLYSFIWEVSAELDATKRQGAEVEAYQCDQNPEGCQYCINGRCIDAEDA